MNDIKKIKQLFKRTPAIFEEISNSINFLLTRLDDFDSTLANLDVKKIQKKYAAILERNDIKSLSEKELDYGCELEGKILQIDELLKKQRETIYTLQAIAHFIKYDNRANIIKYLSNETWQIKHEILTRWAWILAQHKEKLLGKTFNKPYLCEVGSRNRRKKIDREFKTLLCFLPYYCNAKNKFYLFFENPEPPKPDFIIADDLDNKLAIEITDVSVSNKQQYETKQAEMLFKMLNQDFSSKKYVMNINSRPDWSTLKNQYNCLKEWLNEEVFKTLSKNQMGKKYSDFVCKDIGLVITLSYSENGFLILDGSDDGRGLGYFGDIIENQITEALLSSVGSKLEKNYEIDFPCLLVIYNNTGLPLVNFEKVAEMSEKKLYHNWKQNFEDIWLVDDNDAVSLKIEPKGR